MTGRVDDIENATLDVVNTGDGQRRLDSMDTPPEHPAGTVHATEADADAAEAEHGH